MFDFFRAKPSKAKNAIYLDYAAATPVLPEVYEAMRPYFKEVWANPGSIHRDGVFAREAVERARTELARTLHIRPSDVIYTGSGTESNNLALVGVVEELHEAGRAYADMEIISTRIEHPSVLEVLEVLARRGVVVRFVRVRDDGSIDLENFREVLTKQTVLVTCAYVNSEIGVVQDVKRITRMVRAFEREIHTRIYVHLDACQAVLWLPCELDRLGADLVTLDAGKCYGPKGLGVLAMRHGVRLVPLIRGGGQERGLRSSTENVPLIVGGTRALVRAQEGWKSRSEAVASLRDFMVSQLQNRIPSVIINGSLTARVANNVNVSIPGLDAEFGVITLDAAGISASTRSACSTEEGNGSVVVKEISGDDTRAQSTLRFTLGEETTKADIERTLIVLKNHVEKTLKFKAELDNIR